MVAHTHSSCILLAAIDFAFIAVPGVGRLSIYLDSALLWRPVPRHQSPHTNCAVRSSHHPSDQNRVS